MNWTLNSKFSSQFLSKKWLHVEDNLKNRMILLNDAKRLFVFAGTFIIVWHKAVVQLRHKLLMRNDTSGLHVMVWAVISQENDL